MPVYFKVVCDTCGEDFEHFHDRYGTVEELLKYLDENEWSWSIIIRDSVAPRIKVGCPKHPMPKEPEIQEEGEEECEQSK